MLWFMICFVSCQAKVTKAHHVKLKMEGHVQNVLQ
jgi:hypothetical protein